MTPALLVNVVGFFLGAVLYGLLFAMALGSPAPGWPSRWDTRLASSSSRLLVLTGLLGVAWNSGALLAYGLHVPADGPALATLLTASFTALGFLPAVVVHSVLARREEPGLVSISARLTIAAAYAFSVTASLMHVASAMRGHTVPSSTALNVLTAGFALLMVALLVTTRRRPHEGRAIWVVALSVFAVSALHLAQHTGGESWWTEMVGHHASLLLALAILHRDYRFALADIFLKRALALTLLIAVVLTVHVTVGVVWMANETGGTAAPRVTAYLLALSLFAATIHGSMRRASDWFVDAVMLQRPNYEQLRTDIASLIAREEHPQTILTIVTDHLRLALDARWTSVRAWMSDDLFAGGAGSLVAHGRDAERALQQTLRLEDAEDDPRTLGGAPRAVLLVPTVDAPHYACVIGELTAGRRLLSDDLAMLESVAMLAGRRIDAVRVAQERVAASVREQEISRLATEAELRALRAQLNPHFLFNALTTVGYLIQTAPDRAMGTLLRLTSLLRGVLRRTTNEFGTLGDELELIESYLEIEQARFEERLRVTIDVPVSLRTLPVPSLIVQPLVENAVKHGIASSRTGGEVIVAAFLESDEDGENGQLRVSVRDTGVGATQGDLERGRARGLGISSIEHRLRSHYGPAAFLHVSSVPDVGTTVDLIVPVRLPNKTPNGQPSTPVR